MAILNIEILDKMNTRIENELIPLMRTAEYAKTDELIENILQELHKAIPDKKRISYGITYVVKLLSKALYERVEESDLDVFHIATVLYKNLSSFRTKCVGLGMLSYHGLNDIDATLPYFKNAANHEIWEIREFAQMYIRKITKKYPNEVQAFLLSLTQSVDSNHRRFASESLRPVVENRWILKNPEFSLKVLRQLFEESDPYPRVSVGNNLSDLSRQLPEQVFEIVKELVSKENENSYWIANRACRNLVKTEPLRVMDLLKVDIYVYKNKKYKRVIYES
ncbi:hypothetical protein [Oceanirhabdus seepicola]|uniref:DNA alkylation repair protein n=1 Tax=Oceanirhabdus seepicola TaxID=2828781 RepID=A0A9J6P754_9CLOT|nr:hypothetical protein [Oceanirhabdus seepicola]MCM1992615.1 hypothetical protein [Oceanirhabdus seepicola]